MALGCEGNCEGRYGNSVEDANTLLNQSSKWRVNHVRREANQAAHRLARFALTQEEVQLGGLIIQNVLERLYYRRKFLAD